MNKLKCQECNNKITNVNHSVFGVNTLHHCDDCNITYLVYKNEDKYRFRTYLYHYQEPTKDQIYEKVLHKYDVEPLYVKDLKEDIIVVISSSFNFDNSIRIKEIIELVASYRSQSFAGSDLLKHILTHGYTYPIENKTPIIDMEVKDLVYEFYGDDNIISFKIPDLDWEYIY